MEQHPDEIRCKVAKRHVERAMKSLDATDRLDTIKHLRAALIVMEGHVDVARNQKHDEPPNDALSRADVNPQPNKNSDSASA